MELLLLEDIKGLGKAGELVTVAAGYARNYLLPQRLAQVPTAHAVEVVRKKTARLEAAREAEKAEHMARAKKLATVTVELTMKAAKEGHLYGSVSARQIAEALAAKGHTVEEKQILLAEHIKAVGEFDVTVVLHPEVQFPLKVVVAAEGEAPAKA
jgi:large subunit ribosomal protein L9